MRLTYALFASSLTIFGTAIAVTGQEQSLAEQQFKNIQSFKGEKASDIIPAMEFMSASLGVGCDFCHAADRASDEKKTKLAAREMIAMQRDINEKNFGGRLRVTCATCHAGHEHPVGTPPIAGNDIRPHRTPDVKPDQVLAAYSQAAGGDPAHPITGLHLEGTTISRGVPSRLEAFYSGGKFVLISRNPKGVQKQGFNGNLTWYTIPGGIQKVPLVYAESFVNQSTLFTGTGSLPKLDGLTGATAKIGDRDMLVVTGTVEGERTMLALYFDKQTGLLARTTWSYPTILGSVPQIDDYSDYRRAAGVELPMTIDSHSSWGDTLTHYRSAREDSKIDPAVFEPPKG